VPGSEFVSTRRGLLDPIEVLHADLAWVENRVALPLRGAVAHQPVLASSLQPEGNPSKRAGQRGRDGLGVLGLRGPQLVKGVLGGTDGTLDTHTTHLVPTTNPNGNPTGVDLVLGATLTNGGEAATVNNLTWRILHVNPPLEDNLEALEDFTGPNPAK
jgi:hypothetical protein